MLLRPTGRILFDCWQKSYFKSLAACFVRVSVEIAVLNFAKNSSTETKRKQSQLGPRALRHSHLVQKNKLRKM